MDGQSSLAASLSTVAELLKGCVDAVATNRVRWGNRSVLDAPHCTSQSWKLS
jgi:hypothetical protein